MKNIKIHVALDSYFFFERDNFKRIKDFLDNNGKENEIYQLVPFSHEINPKLPEDRLIIPFGCIEFVQEINKLKESRTIVIYNEKVFTNENCLNSWGELCLNSDAKIMTLEEVEKLNPEEQYFIRPLEDLKTFSGNLFQPGMMKSLVERYSGYENNELNLQTKVVVAPPKKIVKEWRNFIIGGKVVSSSMYREGKKHKEDSNVPAEMISFCEKALEKYTPAKAFVLDIGLTENRDYKIIEFGCIHNCGFYSANVEAIMGSFLELFD